MQETTPSQKNAAGAGEIDLRELAAALGRLFTRFITSLIVAIVRLRRTTRNNAWLLLSFMALGTIAGYLSYRSFEPHYSSQLILSSRFYSAEMLNTSILELNQLAEEGNTELLAQKLKLSPQQAASIRTITSMPVTTSEDIVEMQGLLQLIEQNGTTKLNPAQMEALRERLTNTFYNFRIVVTVYDIAFLDALELGLQHYLQENDYIKRRIDIEQENLTAFRTKLLKEQEQLDRLKSIQADFYRSISETGRTGSNNVVFGNPESASDPLNVYMQDINLSREVMATTKKLELNRALEVVTGFTPYGNPASLSLKGQLLLGAALGLASAYLIIFLIGINQALNRYERLHEARKTFA
ncbi:hypothetical protein [Cesiribacter andamanensis]|uniref:Uncharacterized protein n=1 Tax=Cesiribacter andamanensis AMV16 TaxID=1279009 RepID=M7NMG9_9BACT|nr:hypothetical protein [Cesiribacter andamanensis]EMR02975.1 hypothetical protein ADICEAN_01882 [Cesiribacter andamanensis AMV16]